ncbi:anthranilate synthase component I family protein [Psychrobacter sp. CAL346-MNA-CIBAN-0220]|uniref:anthranilate synthase component I family protein n=1 Tax=Psychrobacter sp. CAL346-MNA-CIBAN-0220 TaxID=3140457 RepID=UPI00332C9D58
MKQMSWRFGDLSASELIPLFQRYLTAQDNKVQWQLVWLNNDGKPVIGLLPKVSWSVYFDHTDADSSHHASDPTFTPSNTTSDQALLYKIIKTCRDDNDSVTAAYMSYADWQDELTTYSQTFVSSDSAPTSTNEKDEKLSYHHGLMGFIGYDMAAHDLSPMANIQQLSQPCAILGHYDIYLTPSSSSINSRTYWTLNVQPSHTDSENETASSTLAALISYLDALDNELANTNTTNSKKCWLEPLILTAKWQKTDYQQAFEQTQCYLQQGDCYQINLTQAWQGYLVDSNNLRNNAKTVTTLVDYLPALYRNTQAPFAGYLSVGTLKNNGLKNNHLEKTSLEGKNLDCIGFELLSCSPELFFTFIKNDKTGSHHIRTKPIKGTRPRGINTKQDLTLKQQLTDSNKDRAENVMIVDLLRNDLGKYARTGSVKVPHLFTIESFSNVHHMVSTITAELKEDTHPLAVLFGSLPAGSITGTPKKRAVEIISELEDAPRGAYCGTMGYMNFDGSGQWNVLIRTLQAKHSLNGDKQVNLWAGGGITIASDCDDEYQECLDKVGNLLQVLKQINSE